MDAHPLTRRAFITAVAAAGLVGCGTTRPAAHHQPGVLAHSTPVGAVAAFDVTARDPAELAAVLRAVSSRGATVAVGASLFDDRFGLHRPRRLTVMPRFSGDVLEPARCHGDLLLQALGDTQGELDAMLAPLPGLTERWRVDGRQLPEERNAFGFEEGQGNPATPQVWVTPEDDEPAWCVGGTYLVVRLIRLAMPTWDHKSTEDQERVFGRRKDNGAELAGMIGSHVRRARPENEAHKILRRGYPFTAEPGQLFICYQRDPELGFAATQRRLAGEELEKYVLPFGGGYFFALPGVDGTKEDYLGRAMVEGS
ncbi:deferrochelatase/peroxidase EfeB [Lentzea waywayandensis]|uniref:Deferrochelatase/peroxidase EfeB n=1 Tax=Lentzea waywayandensis TaxID=84724 RepID=A0A1I6FH03_9PSEU|nr:Dyp-type peroxidase [Lentzea waywayandensis]SFR29195.1 deferrochelatase/peroxidase EfeB [Lentzea waywayandensis]